MVVSAIASGAGGIAVRPNDTAASRTPVISSVRIAPWGDSTCLIEHESHRREYRAHEQERREPPVQRRQRPRRARRVERRQEEEHLLVELLDDVVRRDADALADQLLVLAA